MATNSTFPQESGQSVLAACPKCGALDESKADLLAACEAYHKGMDILFAMLIARDRDFLTFASGSPWVSVVKGHSVIARAGEKAIG